MRSPRWTTVQESEFPWEQAALAYVRERLPDAEPFRAWSNFEFIADDGSINEVDLLVVSLHRIYLVEIKSRPGTVTGDSASWRWTGEGADLVTDNPLLLANRKAKKLKDLLRRQKPLKRFGSRMPYVEAVVFLAHQNVKCALTGAARTGVYLRDDAPGGETGIIALLTGEGDRSGAADARFSPDRIDGRLSSAIGRALADAGIRPTHRHRQVGDYVLGELLAESDVYQDWAATHVRFTSSRAGIRIYPDHLSASEVSRAERRRAAEREYRLLDGLDHTGILRVRGFTDHERGPALIFDDPEGAERLDAFLQTRLERLDLRARLGIVRQIAEALQYAHGRRVYHQSLTPQSVLVTEPASEAPGIKLFNWQAGTREALSETGTRLSVADIVKVGLAGEAAGTVYLAPELHSVGALDPAKADVFSLGALAYHLVSGVAPAPSVEVLTERLHRAGGLWLSEVVDGVSEDLEMLVAEATSGEVTERIELADFLARLDTALVHAAPESATDHVSPLDAAAGDVLEGGFVVKQRLGKGSTAVALLVERDGREGVLKVALETKLNDRLRQEAEVLRRARHQNVVELYEVLELGGHTALFMAVAGTGIGSTEDRPGSYTLAQRIRAEGRLTLDLLQRFGEELLGVVDWLEQNGISHRDIKPDNIGIAQTGSKKLTLVLFDFSLAGTPADNIRAGTPPYLEPFLERRRPKRWDLYAERYAAAVTLYEMATGDLPVWGDGKSNPAVLDCEVTLDAEKFDPAVRDNLTRFFAKALARNHRKRYDTAEDMRRAWARVFEHIDRPTTVSDHGDVDLDAAIADATQTTPVITLGLSPRVLNALERLGVHTVGELLELPRIRLYRNQGIGQRTVREIRFLADRLAQHFARADAQNGVQPSAQSGLAEDAPVDPRYWHVDLIARRLVSTQLDADDAAALRALLGLDAPSADGVFWPAQRDVAESMGRPRIEIQQVLDRAIDRWTKQPAVTALRDDVARLLEKHAGILTQAELVRALLAARGSAAGFPERSRNAAAAAYAAIETEAVREAPRFILYRGRDHLLVLATEHLSETFVAPPSARARYAEALGREADRLAGEDPLPGSERVATALAAVPAPAGDRPLPEERLLHLAVAAAKVAALSARNEIYPRGMPAVRALRLGAGSLLGPRTLSPAQVQQRIASRYPEAEPLPGRPQLDALVEEAGVHFRWNDATQAYAPPSLRPTYLDTSSGSWRGTGSTTGHAEASPEAEEAWVAERRLRTAVAERRFLVLTVAPRALPRAEQEILRRFPVRRVSLEAVMLDALKAEAERLGARWDVVTRADAADPDSPDWRRLRQLVARAVGAVQRELESLDEPALLVYPGLLARYGQLGLLEKLRQAAERGHGPGYILLVAQAAQSTMPVVDGVPLPVVLATEWGKLPSSWITGAGATGDATAAFAEAGVHRTPAP